MSPKLRKLVGAIGLLVLIAAYSVGVVAVAAVLQVHQISKPAETVFYLVAGLLWVLPAGWIIKWMQSPGRR